MLLQLALGSLGCRHPASVPTRPDGDGDTDSVVDGGSTTGESGGDSGGATVPEGPLPPSATVVGLPGMWLDTGPTIIATGQGPGILAVKGFDLYHAQEGLPATFLLRGDLPRGENGILDVWDGVSSYDKALFSMPVFDAGDVNGDGLDDVWFGNELRLMPLLGAELRNGVGAVATVPGDGGIIAAGFDADGDGFNDAMFSAGASQASLRYGPFEGELQGVWTVDPPPPSEYALFGWGTCDSDQGTLLRDHLGPGRHVIALGLDPWNDCAVDTQLFEVTGVTAGTWVGDTDRIGMADSIAPNQFFQDAGDLDGDGSPDVLYADEIWSKVLKGPLHGFVPNAPLVIGPPPYEEQRSFVTDVIGDINGDGVQELLVQWTRSWDPNRTPFHFDRSWVVQFSPHPANLDPDRGVDLGIVECVDLYLGAFHGDLDGDGRSDLVGRRGFGNCGEPIPEDYPGEIRIWYGDDLLARWQALVAAGLVDE